MDRRRHVKVQIRIVRPDSQQLTLQRSLLHRLQCQRRHNRVRLWHLQNGLHALRRRNAQLQPPQRKQLLIHRLHVRLGPRPAYRHCAQLRHHLDAYAGEDGPVVRDVGKQAAGRAERSQQRVRGEHDVEVVEDSEEVGLCDGMGLERGRVGTNERPASIVHGLRDSNGPGQGLGINRRGCCAAYKGQDSRYGCLVAGNC